MRSLRPRVINKYQTRLEDKATTALYETTDKRIKLGTFTVAPRPYLYYGVSKGSIVQDNRGAWATYESET